MATSYHQPTLVIAQLLQLVDAHSKLVTSELTQLVSTLSQCLVNTAKIVLSVVGGQFLM